MNAIIDIGSHSVRMQYKDGDTDRRIIRITRLGENMREGRLSVRAMRRTASAIVALTLCARARGHRVFAFATSAMRDAVNRRQLMNCVERIAGVRIELLSGQQEAELAFSAVSEDTLQDIGALDIGGGSTEVIWGKEGKIRYAQSYNVGAVRLTGYELGHTELVALSAEAFAACPPAPEGMLWRGIGGTITSLAAMSQQLVPYDEKRVHGYMLEREAIEQWVKRLAGMSIPERMALPGLKSERGLVILAGSCILLGAMQALKIDRIAACTRDNLDSYAANLEKNLSIEKKHG